MTPPTRRPFPVALAAVASIAAIVIGVAVIAMYVTQTKGSETAGPAAATSPSPAAPRATPSSDPYEVYLTLAPDGAPKLSREDAQARALLGCGQSWAPGTVDAALAKAYADLCQQR